MTWLKTLIVLNGPKKHKKSTFGLWDLVNTEDIGLTTEESLDKLNNK